MSDYVLYAQWHVVTYRVWHLFFVFSSLLCATGWRDGNRWRCFALTTLNYACLYYYEFVFVAYLSVFVGLYTVYLYWRRPLLLTIAVFSQVIGGALSLTLLVCQLIGFYGIEGLKADFYYTFLARNHVSSLADLLENMRDFYQTHNVAFFYNLSDNTSYLTPLAFVRSFFSFDFQTHTPVFTALALILALPVILYRAGVRAADTGLPRPLGWIVGGARSFSGSLDRRAVRWLSVLASASANLVFAIGFALLFLSVTSPSMIDAVAPVDHLIVGRPYLWGVAAGVSLAVVTKWLAGLPPWGVPAGARTRVLLASIMLLAISFFLRRHSALYAADGADIWHKLDAMNYPPVVFQGAILTATILAIIALLAPHSRRLHWHHVHDLRAYLICGLLGYGFAYGMSAGYVYSGYLTRSTPFTVFLTNAVLAAAAYFLIDGLRVGFLTVTGGGGVPRRLVVSALSGSLMLVLVSSWIWQQVDYIRLLPPDYLSFMSRLEQPPYKGASFAVGAYAAPVAAYTGQWAFDSEQWNYWNMRQREPAESVLGMFDAAETAPNDLPYLWMADRRQNTSYLRPQYYLCLANQSMKTLSESLAVPPGGAYSRVCRDVIASVQSVARQPWLALTPSLVDYDRDGIVLRGWPAWAIVKLDWTMPPFLQPVPQGTVARPVRMEVSRSGEGYSLTYRYSYAQADDVAEQGTTIELVQFGASAACGDTNWDVKVLAAHGQGAVGSFKLPHGFVGRVGVRVTPRTTAKAGRPYYSNVSALAEDGKDPIACQEPPLLSGEPGPQQQNLEGYLVPGYAIDFRSSSADNRYFGEGWSAVEEPGTWSVDNISTLRMRLLTPVQKPLRLTARVLPFAASNHPLEVTVLVNGTEVGIWSFDTQGWATVTADIPPEVLEGSREMTITLKAAAENTPVALGVSTDSRRLKLLFETATIAEIPDGVATPAALSPAYYVLGDVIDFRSSGHGERYLGEGWSASEAPGTWSVGRSSLLHLDLDSLAQKPLRLTAKVLPFVVPGHPRQVVTVLANNRAVATWTFDKGGWTTVTADIPADVIGQNGGLVITLKAADPVTPASIGYSKDTRLLKLLFETATIGIP